MTGPADNAGHWAGQYIGTPWVEKQHECGHFFCRVQREQFGLEVAVIDVDAMSVLSCARALSGTHPEYRQWLDTDTPREGDAVQMSHARRPHHIGLWIEADGGGVLHCVEDAGVIFSNRAALRAAGWNIVSIKRHRSRA